MGVAFSSRNIGAWMDRKRMMGMMQMPIQKPLALALSTYSRKATRKAYFIESFRGTQSENPIPKGLCPPAQGREPASYPGWGREKNRQPQRGCGPAARRGLTQPRWG